MVMMTLKTSKFSLSTVRNYLPTQKLAPTPRIWFCSVRLMDDACDVVVADPQLLDNKIDSIRTAGPTKLQILSLSLSHLRLSGSSCSVRLMNDACDYVVADPQLLDNKINSIRTAGPTKLQVIADFDATLTRYWVNGRRGITSHGLLRQSNPKYDEKRRELYYHYHPLEFSPTIQIEEKTKLMEEWWEKSHGLLIEGGLTYDDIKQSVAESVISFRDGVAELFELLEEKDIPVLIFSAGLADVIEEVLRQKLHKVFKNVKIVSNRMVFDENGNLVAFKGKTIHSLNKNERALEMAGPLHDELGDVDGLTFDNASVKTRTNVLLLGDFLGDLHMSDGLDYETRISVGFLNDNVEHSLESYRDAFDIVYLNDAAMSGVVKLVSQLWPNDSVRGPLV